MMKMQELSSPCSCQRFFAVSFIFLLLCFVQRNEIAEIVFEERTSSAPRVVKIQKLFEEQELFERPEFEVDQYAVDQKPVERPTIQRPFAPRYPDCPALLKKNSTEVWKNVKIAENWTYPQISDEEMLYLTSGNCSLLKERIYFPTEPLTEEEREFPLAYGIVVYTNAEQVIRMLSAFYWPQNLYCITYDLKATLLFKRIIINLAQNCFDNIVIPDNFYKMHWCGVGQLHATMSCVQLLNSRTDHDWKYYQYLSGFDFPLKTNFEMVQILKVLNGSTDSFLAPVAHKERDPYYLKKLNTTTIPHDFITEYSTLIPGNLTLLKGSMSTTFSRASANAIVTDSTAIEYFQFLTDVLGQDKRFWSKMCPDEAYWTTVLFNDPTINLPQKSIGELCLDQMKKKNSYYIQKRSVARYQTWEPYFKKKVVTPNCYGKYQHKSCVFGVGDLYTLITRKHFIAHKLYLDFQPATFYCLNEWLSNRTYDQPNFDTSFYEQMVDVRFMQATTDAARTKLDCFL